MREKLVSNLNVGIRGNKGCDEKDLVSLKQELVQGLAGLVEGHVLPTSDVTGVEKHVAAV